jgi:hypothetical protein
MNAPRFKLMTNSVEECVENVRRSIPAAGGNQGSQGKHTVPEDGPGENHGVCAKGEDMV